MSQTRVPFGKYSEGDFIREIRRLNRIISKLSYERDDLQQENQKLKDRIDKAIQHLDCFISDVNLSKYDILKILMHTKKILKGD